MNLRKSFQNHIAATAAASDAAVYEFAATNAAPNYTWLRQSMQGTSMLGTSMQDTSKLGSSMLGTGMMGKRTFSNLKLNTCACLCMSALLITSVPNCFSLAHADSALDDIIALGGNQNTLSKQDIEILKALEASNNPKAKKSAVSRPIVERPGEVRFVYGAGRPTVVCSLLHVCDISLEPGESVVDVQTGDSARWVVGRSAHGSAQGMVEHVTIKPTDIGLESNLTIYTDKRSYSIDIKSSAKDFMPNVSFIYTEQSMQRYQNIKNELLARKRNNELNLSASGEELALADEDEYVSETAAIPGRKRAKSSVALLSGLDFNYQVSGDKEVIPLRVFNDGKHTYVQMPQKLSEGMLPAIVEVTQTHVFSEDATAVTNYRLQGNNFVVDGIPRHLRLFIGNEDSGRAMSADIIRNS
ncbi:MAG: TrbG/VirB9 family P-type conjugative transfer protein [Anaerobiospirillum succiniciproducens]|uniref:TrbG/VirB9 family P-type conjugative transfer protein n=1 Tax=Anaerobiospirillum succiniciproducens TaxID=13335 RepID=UPI0026DC62D8|nr:TrbG/VirB9 family P-type conjugative transfer protein [Anaerobiospirillum succiniciproducens]MDO4675415.1 TrbG/VirB9 family P-type conjugative transfer protein [Anaerobiospirillum succiniciproducens]